MTIRDVMTTDVWRVTPDTPLKEVASILVTANVSGLRCATPTGTCSASCPSGTSSSRNSRARDRTAASRGCCCPTTKTS